MLLHEPSGEFQSLCRYLVRLASSHAHDISIHDGALAEDEDQYDEDGEYGNDDSVVQSRPVEDVTVCCGAAASLSGENVELFFREVCYSRVASFARCDMQF